VTRLADFLGGRSATEIYETCWTPYLLTPFAMEIAQTIASGESVLDVGCGAGLVARLAAARVGPTGRIVGVDPAAHLLAVGRECKLPCRSEWIEGSAESLPVDDHAFDVVVCHQVWQYVSDAALAFREMARAAKTGGRVIGGVWAGADMQPAYGALEVAMGRRLGGEFGAIHSLRFGGLARLGELARAAGLTITRLETITRAAPFPSIREFVELQCAGGARPLANGGFEMGLFDLDDESFEPRVEALVADMEAQLAAHATPKGFFAPVACDIIEARA
jgi:SAM-dependent methyltransferase